MKKLSLPKLFIRFPCSTAIWSKYNISVDLCDRTAASGRSMDGETVPISVKGHSFVLRFFTILSMVPL